MLLCNSFVFIHFPKTGGTFVTSALERVARETPGFVCEDTAASGTKHRGVDCIPTPHRDKPLVMVVRNILDHYCSFYKFDYWRACSNSIFCCDAMRKIYPSYPDLSFHDFARAFNSWPLIAHTEKIRSDVNAAEIFQQHEIGYLTWFFLHLTQPDPFETALRLDEIDDKELAARFANFHFLHLENLNAELHALLTNHGVPRNDLAFIKDMGKENVTRKDKGLKAKWRDNFTEELKQFVLRRERFLFRLFPRYAAEANRYV